MHLFHLSPCFCDRTSRVSRDAELVPHLGRRKLRSSTWSADISTFLGYRKAKWWLYFLEIISPTTSSQPQEVKPVLRHSADSQLRNQLDGAHLQISCARLFPHFRWVDVTHSKFILRKKNPKTVKGEKGKPHTTGVTCKLINYSK